MFAANRNDKVIGRTIILDVSINTKNGLSQSGAPSGRKWAIDAFKFIENLDRIIDSHNGNPNLKVKIKCLDKLKMYGIRPIKLITIIIKKRDIIEELIPLRLIINVRISWAIIIELIGLIIAILRVWAIQNEDWINVII
jgi:hypothetical protein